MGVLHVEQWWGGRGWQVEGERFSPVTLQVRNNDLGLPGSPSPFHSTLDSPHTGEEKEDLVQWKLGGKKIKRGA